MTSQPVIYHSRRVHRQISAINQRWPCLKHKAHCIYNCVAACHGRGEYICLCGPLIVWRWPDKSDLWIILLFNNKRCLLSSRWMRWCSPFAQASDKRQLYSFLTTDNGPAETGHLDRSMKQLTHSGQIHPITVRSHWLEMPTEVTVKI